MCQYPTYLTFNQHCVILHTMKYILITLALLFTFGLGGFAVLRVIPDQPVVVQQEVSPEDVKYTGQEVLAELQKYRAKNNLPPFELSFKLCNNISARWASYMKNDSHEGLDDFVDKNMPGMTVGEALTPGRTPEEAVQNLADSPSHDLALKSYSDICVYTSEGHSVLLMSN